MIDTALDCWNDRVLVTIMHAISHMVTADAMIDVVACGEGYCKNVDISLCIHVYVYGMDAWPYYQWDKQMAF